MRSPPPRKKRPDVSLRKAATAVVFERPTPSFAGMTRHDSSEGVRVQMYVKG